MSSRNRIAIIVSVTIIGALLIACVAWLLQSKYAWRKRTQWPSPSAESTVKPYSEVEEKAKVELPPDGKQVYEVSGEGYLHEATDGIFGIEGDGPNMIVCAVELPAMNFSEEIEDISHQNAQSHTLGQR